MPPIPRREFLVSLGSRAAALTLAGHACAFPRRSLDLPMYIGTYTRDESRGIYAARLSSSAGILEVREAATGIENPSFLIANAARTRLYAVSEVGELLGRPGGGVVSYAINADAGLTELNRQPTGGGAPCHLGLDRTGQCLLVANYMGGNVAAFPLAPDGSLLPAAQVVQHEGSGPNPNRQEGPHAHWAGVDAANRFAFVVDLGIDRVVGYRIDPASARLEPAPGAGFASRPGAGPRHLDFHPSEPFAFIINELDSTLTSVGYHADTGRMEEVQTVSTLPAGYTASSSCAEIVVHPSGRFVYGSNRGHDSIVVFGIEAGTGRLTLVQHQPTLGRTPRNFALDPTGRFLAAANQDSNSLVVFSIDSATGRLTPAGEPTEVPVPVCVLFT